MTDRFDACLPHILHHEGGLNSPSPRGALVAGLLKTGGPLAVFGRVAKIVVDPLQREIGRAPAHIG